MTEAQIEKKKERKQARIAGYVALLLMFYGAVSFVMDIISFLQR